jgi:L-phenylalanine/L-methionine N-acetyltransferase
MRTSTTIRPQEPADWQEVSALLAMPKVVWGTSQMPYAAHENRRKWLEPAQDNATRLLAVRDGKIVGSGGLFCQANRRAHVASLGLCVHDDFHGQGVGRLLMNTLIDAADNWLNLRRLELMVDADNEAAIHLYKTSGFEIEGTKRDYVFRGGAFADVFSMARLRR